MLKNMLKELSKDNTDTTIVSHEIIAEQTNDYVIPKVTQLFTDIKKRVVDMGSVKASKYFRDKEFVKLYKELDLVISNRFGINFKHVGDDMSGYSTMTMVPSNSTNTIKKYNLEIMNNMDTILQTYGKKDTDVDNILDYNDDYLEILTKNKQAIDSLEKTLNSNGILIDLSKAKISGLPKEYVVFIFVTPSFMMIDMDMEPEELCAILMHEIGHAFTHLEYSYRNINTTSVLMDTIIEEANKNKSTKDILKLVYTDVLNKDEKDIKDSNVITAGLTVISSYLQSLRQVDYNYYNMTDSEQLADQFATRMGVGPILIGALDKWNTKFGYVPIEYVDIEDTSIKLMGIFAIIYLVVITTPIIGIIVGLLTTIMIIIAKLFMNNDSTLATTYDDDYNRFKRIRNDLIHRLRTCTLDKKNIKVIIDNIDYADTILNKYVKPDIQTGLFKKLYYKVHPNKINYLAIRELEQMLEDLNENNLYLAGAKLKQI